MIDHNRLIQLLRYNKATGQFTWRVTRHRAIARQKAGTIRLDGYVALMIEQRLYRAHRLAWFYVTGEWPKGHIDHINQIRNDNRWSNLRDVTPQQNSLNARRRLGASGFRGVRWYQKNQKWGVVIGENGRRVFLGLFSDKADAAAAYQARYRVIYGTD